MFAAFYERNPYLSDGENWLRWAVATALFSAVFAAVQWSNRRRPQPPG